MRTPNISFTPRSVDDSPSTTESDVMKENAKLIGQLSREKVTRVAEDRIAKMFLPSPGNQSFVSSQPVPTPLNSHPHKGETWRRQKKGCSEARKNRKTPQLAQKIHPAIRTRAYDRAQKIVKTGNAVIDYGVEIIEAHNNGSTSPFRDGAKQLAKNKVADATVNSGIKVAAQILGVPSLPLIGAASALEVVGPVAERLVENIDQDKPFKKHLLSKASIHRSYTPETDELDGYIAAKALAAGSRGLARVKQTIRDVISPSAQAAPRRSPIQNREIVGRPLNTSQNTAPSEAPSPPMTSASTAQKAKKKAQEVLPRSSSSAERKKNKAALTKNRVGKKPPPTPPTSSASTAQKTKKKARDVLPRSNSSAEPKNPKAALTKNRIVKEILTGVARSGVDSIARDLARPAEQRSTSGMMQAVTISMGRQAATQAAHLLIDHGTHLVFPQSPNCPSAGQIVQIGSAIYTLVSPTASNEERVVQALKAGSSFLPHGDHMARAIPIVNKLRHAESDYEFGDAVLDGAGDVVDVVADKAGMIVAPAGPVASLVVYGLVKLVGTKLLQADESEGISSAEVNQRSVPVSYRTRSHAFAHKNVWTVLDGELEGLTILDEGLGRGKDADIALQNRLAPIEKAIHDGHETIRSSVENGQKLLDRRDFDGVSKEVAALHTVAAQMPKEVLQEPDSRGYVTRLRSKAIMEASILNYNKTMVELTDNPNQSSQDLQCKRQPVAQLEWDAASQGDKGLQAIARKRGFQLDVQIKATKVLEQVREGGFSSAHHGQEDLDRFIQEKTQNGSTSQDLLLEEAKDAKIVSKKLKHRTDFEEMKSILSSPTSLPSSSISKQKPIRFTDLVSKPVPTIAHLTPEEKSEAGIRLYSHRHAFSSSDLSTLRNQGISLNRGYATEREQRMAAIGAVAAPLIIEAAKWTGEKAWRGAKVASFSIRRGLIPSQKEQIMDLADKAVQEIALLTDDQVEAMADMPLSKKEESVRNLTAEYLMVKARHNLFNQPMFEPTGPDPEDVKQVSCDDYGVNYARAYLNVKAAFYLHHTEALRDQFLMTALVFKGSRAHFYNETLSLTNEEREYVPNAVALLREMAQTECPPIATLYSVDSDSPFSNVRTHFHNAKHQLEAVLKLERNQAVLDQLKEFRLVELAVKSLHRKEKQSPEALLSDVTVLPEATRNGAVERRVFQRFIDLRHDLTNSKPSSKEWLNNLRITFAALSVLRHQDWLMRYHKERWMRIAFQKSEKMYHSHMNINLQSLPVDPQTPRGEINRAAAILIDRGDQQQENGGYRQAAYYYRAAYLLQPTDLLMQKYQRVSDRISFWKNPQWLASFTDIFRKCPVDVNE